METIYEIDTIKIEKEKAMRRYRNFRKIANIVRIVEVMIAITLISFVISKTSSCIPTVFGFSGVIFRRLSAIWLSPLFLFVICNVIVVTLFANYSPPSTENFGENSPGNDDVSVEVAAEIDDVVEIMASDVAAVEIPATEIAAAEIPATEVAAVEIEVTEKVYRRSRSEAIVEVVEKPELRRSATVTRRKSGSDVVSATEMEADARNDEDELSNEEFNRRVEEFIEKQRKFLSEESKILVSSMSN